MTTTPNKSLPSKVLVCDTDSGILRFITTSLEAYKITVLTATDAATAMYLFNQNKFDLCILSSRIDEMLATTLIQRWRNHEVISKQRVPYIIMTGQAGAASEKNLLSELGDIVIFPKPIKIPPLLGIMANSIATKAKTEDILAAQNKIEPLIKLRKFEKAIALGEELYRPHGATGVFEIAKIHYEGANFDSSLGLVREISNRDPNNISYLNHMASCFMHLNKLDEATKIFEKADALAPKNMDRLNKMAEVYLRLAEPDKSIAKMSEILELNPDMPDLKYSFYEQVFSAGYEDQAREFCKATSTPLELIKYYNNKGVIFSKNSQPELAIKEYEKAISLVPKSKERYRILYNLAISHINLKTPENLKLAHGYLVRCLELSPDYEKAKDKLAITAPYSDK